VSERTDSVKRARILSEIREKAPELQQAALDKKAAEQHYADLSAHLKPMVEEVDGPNGVGIRFDGLNGDQAVKLVQNKPTLVWNAPDLIAELKSRGVWKKVSTEELSPEKLAAEIAAGNLPDFKEFQVEVPGNSPSLRIVNAKPESL
jgi:hypothetical protein